jgi:hypothetical protein
MAPDFLSFITLSSAFELRHQPLGTLEIFLLDLEDFGLSS